jgi:branched-chain amino acid transport system substrate-binding protein
MMQRRNFCLRAAATLAASVGSPLLARAQTPPPVRVGFSIARTGPLGAPSSSQLQAYELWREQVNARGGMDIGGTGKRPVEFVSYDDQSQGASAARVYEKLITDDKVDLLLAPYATAMHMAIIPVIERLRFPLLANTIGSNQAKDAKTKYMFFTQPFPEQWAQALVPLMQSIKVSRVGLVTAQLPFSLDVKKVLLPLLQAAGIQVIFDEDYPGDIKDMTTMISGLKSAKPDFVVGLSYLNDSVLYTTQARELGLEVPYQFTLIGPAQASFVGRLGPNANGVITLGQWSRNATQWPRAKPFFESYQARWKMVPDDKDTTIGFVTCEVLEQAVAKAGLDKEKLRAALASNTFDSIMGPVKYDDRGHNTAMPAGFMQIQKGINEVIWPRSIATAEILKKPGWQ